MLVRSIETLKKNRLFQFAASVKMSVPLMVGILIVVAVGTVIESKYNAQVASILVYRTWWFEILMGLLWFNIFFATIARIPFKQQHTGFVIIHIGLLTLLAGGVMTSRMGIDGSLRVMEGQSNNRVGLAELALKVASSQSNVIQTYDMKRALEPMGRDDLGFSRLRATTGLIVERYLPFVVREQGYVPATDGSPGDGVLVDYTLESGMFGKAQDMLHSKDRPQSQMGPALFHLWIDQEDSAPQGKRQKKAAQSAVGHSAERSVASAATPQGVLVIKDSKGVEMGQVKLADLKKGKKNVQGISVSLLKTFEQAVVADNKLVDKGEKGANPAIEVKLEKGGKSFREVSFAKYPGFALSGAATELGIQLEYRLDSIQVDAAAAAALPQGHPPMGSGAQGGMQDEMAAAHAGMGAPGTMSGMGMGEGEMGATSRFDFHFFKKDPSVIRLDLHKGGKKVFSKNFKAGETLETPWMGMKIKLNSIIPNAVVKDEIKPATMNPRGMMPDSAILVRHESAKIEDAVWIPEGEYKTIRGTNASYEVYFGMETVELPFAISLEKFEKLDYPGTETPMSFQSTVKVNGGGNPILISMNEPLKYHGFTLYQSSYEMGQGMPTASIFSVNKDPGRGVKYLGSLILCLGIIIFSAMRSKWFMDWQKRGGSMKAKMAVFFLVGLMGLTASQFSTQAWAAENASALSPEMAQEQFKMFASKIDSSEIAKLPVQNRGRVKPLHSFAREGILFVAGKYGQWGLDAVQLYLGLILSPAASSIELINVRDPGLREKLGFSKKQRGYSLAELEGTKLEELARPALAHQERDSKGLSSEEKALSETMQQVWLMRAIISGRHLFDAMVFPGTEAEKMAKAGGMVSSPVIDKMQNYLKTLSGGDHVAGNLMAYEIVEAAKAQPMPEMFQKNIGKMGIEVWFNKAKLFFFTAVLYLLLGIFLVFPFLRTKFLEGKVGLILGMMAVPFFLHNLGFILRVYITGFAPVTNMYGTMIWVAYGVTLFGGLLFAIYRHYTVLGYILLGSALTLFLTESLPLILSPDMDPIVAVLRNNFWLTIHVLTITISYAAFTISMLLGNVALVRGIVTALKGASAKALASDEKFYKEYGHLNYRVIQLGVFFLTAGIILGGIWADYSWGRFWGWDPKETWALIADLGYLAILHARYLGWLKPFGVLAVSPVAYLLVIMAWYGVNFILAAGLHSYGFSSGGAAMVGTFVFIQLALIGVAFLVQNWKKAQVAAK